MATAWPFDEAFELENPDQEPEARQAPAFPRPAPIHSLVAPAGEAEPSVTVSEGLASLLADLGVTHAFGIIGGAIAPFCEALNRSSIELMHFRHETGAAFAAIEASIASGKPVVVFSTTGPGLTNSLTGMAAARWEGAKVIFVSATTGPVQRGRFAFQETSAYTMLPGLFSAGPLFHAAALIEDPAELAVISARLASGLERPGGFVAHIGLPVAVQTADAGPPPRPRLSSVGPPSVSAAQIDECVQLLSQGSFAIWVGFGARKAAAAIRALAEMTGARVLCSPRGKGIFPESHPQFVGVTGLGGHATVERFFREQKPERVLVLGSRLGEFTSFWGGELVPPKGFVHVDVDSEAFGAAYPSAETVAVQADVTAFVAALCASWPASASRPVAARRDSLPARTPPRRERTVRPSYLMEAIQRVVVENSRAIVITEAGNAFALGTHHLHFDEPGRYRVSTGFGSMGHAVSGVVGAALGSGRRAVAIAGDGAMLMQSEISTAVQYGIDTLWIVLNDSRYGMIEQGMRSLEWSPFATEIPPADFVMIARGMGADGVRIEHESQIDAALELAMHAKGPFVLDVVIDPSERAPSGKRNQSLARQGVK